MKSSDLDEYVLLLGEHRYLASRKCQEGLSADEEVRLGVVRERLDDLWDARHQDDESLFEDVLNEKL